MRALIILLGFLGLNCALAQTGPGGVGNSTSLPLWLKADVGTNTTSNFSAVNQWNDMSGNANNAAQTTGARQPLYTTGLVNGMPALFFDNTAGPNNDFMIVPDADNLDNTSGLTILSVSRPISLDNSSARAIISKRTDATVDQAYTLFFYTNNKIYVDVESNDNRFGTNSAFQPGRDYVISAVYDGSLTAAQRVRVYINNNLDITANETATAISNNISPVTIGTMNQGDGRPFGGYISEVVVFRKALNFVERVVAHNYLFAKYGFSGSSAPATAADIYAGDNPALGDYDFELGGVGTESTGSNTSVSSTVTGGLGLSQVSGYDNSDYLLYAHQAGANSAQISDVAGMTGSNNARWSRIWYFDISNTGAVQTVNITFNLNDAGTPATPANAANYVLLMRTANSGTWTEVQTASGIAGSNINFNNVSVPADAYYTLGSRNYLSSPLPITLREFTGKLNEKGVELTWVTATEHNNDYFTIQRSHDGKDFRTITKVPGSGNSTRDVVYSFTDTEPFADRTYYRLFQTDYDGTTTNLKTIVVKTTDRPGLIEVIPNPSNGNFWFELPDNVVNSQLKIFDSAGAPVNFNYSTIGTKVMIDAQALPKGLYIIKLIGERRAYAAKFVVE